MYVIKRSGQQEPVMYDKVTERVRKLCYGLNAEYVVPQRVTKYVISGIFDGVTTSQLDELAAQTAASMTPIHPDYAVLAARIAVSNLHKNTKKKFSEVISDLYHYVQKETSAKAGLIADDVYEVVMQNKEQFDAAIVHARDSFYDYFGFRTLEKSYLLKIDGKIVERPQHMIMRVAVGIHKSDIASVIETYNMMSEKWFTHATPTLFNAGTPKPQLSSCFLLTTKDDSIDGIFDTLKQCAQISKSAGGIGLSIHNIRANGSYIKGTNGSSNGIVPMLRVFNDTARYVDQGGGKRKGAFAIYLEPWHADIMEFLDLKKNNGKEEMRARDLFYGMWIPDLFMKRLKVDGDWSLFCPNECPELAESHSAVFESLYEKYEAEGKAKKTIKASEVWLKILSSQVETGTPYILYKDHANSKSNQQNLGTIKSSNLCCEIIEYTSADEVAVCNLASIALNKFVKEDKTFDFEKLEEVTARVTRNLNRIIDVNYYPVKEAENSNLRHRPIGIGVQGLADAFILMRFPFDSPQAAKLNKDIFETIYYASMKTSIELAKEEGKYSSFEGSPLSKGLFQFDLWKVNPGNERYDWDVLRQEVMKHGARNSLLLAPMPTASTSQILGNNECFEPYTSNIYIRRVNSGDFIIVNKHLLNDLVELGLWSEGLKNKIIAADGSIQGIAEIPQHIKNLYKTVWEIKQRVIIDMAADRGAFICQSQSMNIHLENPNNAMLTAMHIHAWEKGLKTGTYYLRSKAATRAAQVTIEKEVAQIPASEEVNNLNIPSIKEPAKFAEDILDSFTAEPVQGPVCTMEEGCITCSG